MTRRDYEGNAVPAVLTGSITSTGLTIAIDVATGWPTGGGSGKFFVTIDRGLSTEERVLVSSRSGLTLTVAAVGDRGVDGTAASAHDPNASIEHTFSGTDADEANQHVNDVALDHHTQYMKADGTRHDLAARHAFGTTFATPGAPPDIATAGAAGAAAGPARSDHTHKVGTGALNASGMFAAGVVNAAALGTDAVTAVKILADAVTTAKIINDAVTTAKILNDNITTAKILNANVTPAKLSSPARTNHVPTVSGWAIGNGVLSTSYDKIFRTVHYGGKLTAGTTTTFGAALSLTLPLNNVANRWLGLVATVQDLSTGQWFPVMARVDAGNLIFYPVAASGTYLVVDNNGLKDTTFPFDWTTSDTVEWEITYETDA